MVNHSLGEHAWPAVVLCVFNRPSHTAQVIAELRRVAPPRIFVIADGPRPDQPDDAVKCAEVRCVLDQIDWPCAVVVNAAAANLGLKRRIETGLDWVFDQVDEAIIIEDDCLPHPSFFAFCAELLARYRTDTRIWAISGNCLITDQYTASDSYFFSRYAHMWGWATWRRVWRLHDPSMARWPALRAQGWLHARLGERRAVEYWNYIFEMAHLRPHTWDYPLILSCWLHDGLCITPIVNLVRNIGFGPDATHTTQVGARAAQLRTEAMYFPLVHPPLVVRDVTADALTEQVEYSGNLTATLRHLRGRIHQTKDRQLPNLASSPGQRIEL